MRTFSRHFFSGVLLTGLAIAVQAQDALAPPYGMPITLAQAEKVIVAAKVEAARLKLIVVVIAVADTHGELVAFAKLDDATVHSIEFAQLKARGAARSRRVTATPPTDMAAALTAMPDFVAMPGGIPIVVGGKTIGAVGVSGGNDLQIAEAAVKALQ
jgi:glc operon protein GlcG